MILVGQYDSPYTRRVAVSLHLLGFDFEHDTRSVFADFDSMRTTNPLGRIMGNVYLRVASPGVATQVFDRERKALAWLEGHRKPDRATAE